MPPTEPLSTENRAVFEAVFADDLPYTDREGMILSEGALNRLLDAARASSLPAVEVGEEYAAAFMAGWLSSGDSIGLGPHGLNVAEAYAVFTRGERPCGSKVFEGALQKMLDALPPHARGGTPCGEERSLLAELFALVKGECPGLLNEDSGGAAKLCLAIEDALSAPPAPGGLSAGTAEPAATPQEGRPDGGEPSAADADHEPSNGETL